MKTLILTFGLTLAGCTLVGCGDSTAANQIDLTDEAAIEKYEQNVEDEERAHNQQMRDEAAQQNPGK